MSSEKLRKILSGIKGVKTIDSLAEELNMGKSTVQAMVDFMLHTGYIEEITCGNRCSSCSMDCGIQPPSGMKLYVVTEKGRSILNKGTDAKR
jgi:hypothetical protein